MKEACSARLVMSRKFAEYIGVLRMLACVASIFLIFSASALAQEPNSSRGQDLLVLQQNHALPYLPCISAKSR